MTLLADYGEERDLGAYVINTVPVGEGIAFALADGRVSIDLATPFQAHEGGILCATSFGLGMATGGDDGLVRRIGPDGGLETLADLNGKWIDQISAAEGTGVAAASGKSVHLIKPGVGVVRSLNHSSTVSGLAFDPKGKRLACAHYDGVSLWWANAAEGEPTPLKWKGSHIGVTWSPDGRFVVTAMQENALHGWRLSDQADMRMSGYPSKTRSMAWASKGKWLATSGAGSVICWPFADKNGPMGKPGLEMPGLGGALVTQVAAHPQRAFVAAGFSDGTVMMYRLDDEAELIVAEPQDSAVSALAFGNEGALLAFGCENGRAGLLTLPS